MTATHEFELQAKCPVDDSRDIYRCSVEVDRMIQCEAILSTAKKIATVAPIFQEELTQQIADAIGGMTTTTGLHKCGVTTTVVCHPRVA